MPIFRNVTSFVHLPDTPRHIIPASRHITQTSHLSRITQTGGFVEDVFSVDSLLGIAQSRLRDADSIPSVQTRQVPAAVRPRQRHPPAADSSRRNDGPLRHPWPCQYLSPSARPPAAVSPDRAVESGTFSADVFTSLTIRGRKVPFKLYEETEDLCDRAVCPIKEGPVAFTYDKLLPKIAPPVSLFDTHPCSIRPRRGTIASRLRQRMRLANC